MLSNILDVLREESDSVEAAYSQFMLAFENAQNVLYCFYEGSDDPCYYHIRVQENASHCRIIDITCGTKRQVLKTYELIKSFDEYNATRLAFFVDRDFDPLLGNDDIYETPVHSIENLYTGRDTMEQVLVRLLNIERRSSDFEKCLNTYLSLFDRFHQSVMPINAWLSCYIDKRHNVGIEKQVHLRDILDDLFSEVVSVDLTNIQIVKPINTFEELQVFFNNAIDVTHELFDLKINGYQFENPFSLFRGKFEIQFLSSFLHRLKHKIQAKNNGFSEKKYKCDYSFNEGIIINQLSMYAATPICLREYIRRKTA
jgi:hypothetical protein